MARTPLSSARTPHLLALEPRVMFDGAAAATLHDGLARDAQMRAFDHAPAFARAESGDRLGEAHVVGAGSLPGRDNVNASRADAPGPLTPRTETPTPAASPGAASRQVIFIDTSVADYQQLARDWAKQGEVVLIDKDQDGLAQMEAALAGRSDVEAIHIVGHGEEGALFIGDTRLDEAAITGSRSQDLAAIGRALGAGGDILVYGCDFAQGSDGARALDSLATVTGADVAASTDLTGSAALGGDWTLEAHHGVIQARTLSDTAWAHELTPGPVNAVPISVTADSLTVKDASGATVASGASMGFTNGYSVAVGAGATARWTGVATQNGVTYDLVATVVSVSPNDYVQFQHPTGQTQNNKTGDDATFLLTDNSGNSNSTGDGASVQIFWQLVQTNTNTPAPADVTFNVLDIDGVGGRPNSRESVTAKASELSYYTHESVSDINFNYDAANDKLVASGTQDENPNYPTDPTIGTQSEASFSYKKTSGFTLTYALAPMNGAARQARFFQDGDSDFAYTTPVYGSIPHLNLDPDGSTHPDMPTDAHFTFTANGAAVPVVDSDVLVTNPEAEESITSATVTLTNAKPGDMLNVGALPSNNRITASTSNANGVITVTLSGAGSETDYQAAYRAITFQNSSATPDTTQRVVNVSFTNDVGYVASATSRIDVADPPVNTLPASYTTAEDTPLQLTGLSVADMDPRAGQLTITLSVPAGTLSATSAGNVTATGSGTGSLSLTGTQADLDAYLGGANAPIFTGARDANGVVTLTMVTSDNGSTGTGGAQTDTDTSTITITPVNDPPVNTLPSSYTVAEDTALSLSGISVSDVDAGTGQETITLSVPDGAGTLAAASGGGVVVSGSGTRSLVLSGTLADLNAYLGDASTRPTFTGAQDANGPVTLTMVTNDGGNTGAGGPQSDTDTSTITVTPVNDPPVNTLPASYTVAEDGGALSLSGISVSDVDAGNGVETITFSVPGGSGVLAAASAGGVTASGSGGTSVTLSGTLAALNSYLGDAATRPTFTSAPDYNGAVTLTMVTDDGGATGAGGPQRDTDTSTITVTPVNDPPVNTLPASYTVAEDTALSLSGISVSDVDGGAGSETITLSVPNGAGTLVATSGGGVVVSGSGTGTLTLNGALADLNAFLGSASTRPTFTGAQDANGPVTLTMVTNDNGNTGSGGPQSDMDTSTITVTPVNDRPVNSLPSGYTTAEDGGPLSLSGISVSDVDAGSGVETITFSVPDGSGVLTAVSAGGVAASGSGGTSVTLSGTLADLNAYLGGASTRPSFTSAPDFNGAVTLTMVTDDNGNTGAGGPQRGNDTSTITVTAVNDPPVNTVPASYAGAEETPLSLSGISVSDVDAGAGVETVTLSVPSGSGGLTAASAGGVTASGSGGTSLTLSGTLADLNAYLGGASTRPVFTGAQGRTDPVTLTVKTSDNGNTGAGGAQTDTDTSNITLHAVNHPPAARGTLPARSAQDAQTVSYPTAGGFSDPDGDTLSYSATGLPAGLSVDPASGVISGTLDRSASQPDGGAYTVSVRATDPSGASATQGFSLAVTNPAPTARDDAASTRLGAPVTVTVLGNDSDPDGDPLVVTGAGGAGHGAVQVSREGTITYSPDAGFSGNDSFIYTISDGQGGTSSARVSVTVTPDGAPVARPDQATTSPGAPVTVPVLANDSDPDGDPLTVTGTSAGHGAVSVNPDGTLTYTPDAGFTGVDTLTYAISDGRGGTASSTVAVTVQAAPNGAPRARPDQAATTAGTPVTVSVLANDIDPDNDPLTVTQAGGAQHGSVSRNADGTLTYTPDAGFTGVDSFTYAISDGRGGAASATVDVTVGAAPNVPPTARPDTAATAAGAPVTIAVLANDSDPYGEPLTLTAVGAAQHGAVTQNPDGTLTYTPEAGFTGSDSFTYAISDARGGSAMSVVNVAVGAPSDAPPTARRDQAATAPGAPVTVAVLANDSDPDGDPLTLTGASAGNGAVALNPDGTLTYTPNAGFTGVDTITYTISDGRGGAGASTVAVTVGGAPNTPPVARPDQAITVEGRPVTVAVLANDTDADGDPLAPTAAGASHGAVTLNADGTLTYTPDAGFSGVDTITYSIADGRGGMAISTVAVTVDGAPVARPDQAATAAGEPVRIAVLANDTDPAGDPLSVTRAEAANGAVTLNPDGTLTYTPNTGFAGVDTITYAVSDGRGGVATSIVSVTVEGPPTARPDVASTSPGKPQTLDVLANDSGPPGAHLAVTSASAGHGTVVIDPDGTLTYSPNAGFRGADVITYAVSADGGPAATTTATVAVGRPTADVDTLLAIGRVTFPDPGGALEGPPPADQGVEAASAARAPDLRPRRVEDALPLDADAAALADSGQGVGRSRSPAGSGLSVHDAVSGARTLDDTNITRRIVGGAVDAVRRLDGTSIDRDAPVAAEVRRLDDDADFRDAGERAFDPRWSDFAPKPLAGFSRAAEGDGAVMFDSVVRGGAIYLDVQDIATDGRAPIRDFTVTPTFGGALPGWITVDRRGLAIIERPADVDELHLVLQVTRQDGRVLRTPMVIQGATGEIELDRRATPPPPETPRGHGRHPQAGERHARLDHTLSTAKARRRHEAEALHRSFR